MEVFDILKEISGYLKTTSISINAIKQILQKNTNHIESCWQENVKEIAEIKNAVNRLSIEVISKNYTYLTHPKGIIIGAEK